MLNKKLLAALALAGGFATAMSAGAATVVIGNISVTQVGHQNARTFDNNPIGAMTGTSVAVYNGVNGAISFTAGGDTLGVFQGSDQTNAAEPAGDGSHYLYAVRSPTTVYFGGPTAGAQVHSFLIYWGSIDAKSPVNRYDNVLTLSNGDSITGSQLYGLFTPPVNGLGDRFSANDNKWFLISDEKAFSSFSVTSNGVHAFEFDMAAVPEPSVWAMLLVGFGAIGFMMRTRRKESALTA